MKVDTHLKSKISRAVHLQVARARNDRREHPHYSPTQDAYYVRIYAAVRIETLLDDHYDGTRPIRPAKLRETLETLYLMLCDEEAEEQQS